ncbi:hypothetical protein F8388_023720 [Cannabis sativa]|uniref:Phytosulfokine n=1 Tax=Cannabis sativa TaxID=3483 RepID=A0A7J6H0A8_CANSA|nr:hypothetical protein F8388_023720 [Cannabis sativa]KAF4388662.1 hypothetical protein G4B88_018939 [Cannabis sativa]
MKQNYFTYQYLLLFLFIFLFIISSSPKLTSATFLATKHDGIQEEQKLNIEELGMRSESLDELMGLEDCLNEEDEECLKRRIIAEAHLDYIYTQNHKP